MLKILRRRWKAFGRAAAAVGMLLSFPQQAFACGVPTGFFDFFWWLRGILEAVKQSVIG